MIRRAEIAAGVCLLGCVVAGSLAWTRRPDGSADDSADDHENQHDPSAV